MLEGKNSLHRMSGPDDERYARLMIPRSEGSASKVRFTRKFTTWYRSLVQYSMQYGTIYTAALYCQAAYPTLSPRMVCLGARLRLDEQECKRELDGGGWRLYSSCTVVK